MASRFKLAMALAGAISIGSHAWAADPPGAEPAQPLDERITNGPDDRTPPDRPARRSGDTLDPLGPAQPEGLAPSPTPGERQPQPRGAAGAPDARDARREGPAGVASVGRRDQALTRKCGPGAPNRAPGDR
jgi:hypothetical protein